METWQGILLTLGIVIVALVIYDRFVKEQLGGV